jgi:hypothetical protein
MYAPQEPPPLKIEASFIEKKKPVKKEPVKKPSIFA